MEKNNNIAIAHNGSMSQELFQEEFLLQLNHGYLDYDFLKTHKPAFMEMLEIDLENYKKNKFCESAQIKSEISAEALKNLKTEDDFKKYVNEYTNKINEIHYF